MIGDPGRRSADAQATVLSRRYVDALRVAQTSAAEQVVDDALAAGLSPSAIQSLVIEPAMVSIGRLWEADAITVADEHLATAVSQSMLVKLFDRLSVARPRSRERVLLAAAEGQHHVLGLRMIADVMEGAGFDVLYLGADVPVDALRRFAAEHQPAITGLGFAVSVGVGVLAESIHVVHEACPATRIMLGGRAVPPGLVEAGYTRVDNSMDVLSVAEHLLGQDPRIPDPPPADAASGATRAARAARGGVRFGPGRRAHGGGHRGRDGHGPGLRAPRRRVQGPHMSRPGHRVGNRRAFDDRMHARSADSDSGHGALLMIDVDGFKVVNDTHGPAAGDVLLRRIGELTTEAVGSHDFVARVGGDEFGVLLTRATRDEARAVAVRITHAVAAAADLPVTVSIGLTPLQGSPRGTLLAAYLALYEAKAAGGNGVRESAGAPVPPVARKAVT